MLLRLLAMPLAALALSACSSGSGETATAATVEGQFLDAEVEGLEVRNQGRSSRTGPNGDFLYAPGTTVEFRIGDVLLGSATGEETMTPVELSSGAVSETSPRVTNLARFLQSLDANSDPEDGIEISAQARQGLRGRSVDFDQSIADFESDPAVMGALMDAGATGGLVDATTAQQHLRNSLFRRSAGSYAASYTGDLSGNFVFVVASDGALVGALDLDGTRITLLGTAGRRRIGMFGDGGDLEFTGAFGRRAAGTWQNTSTNESGDWTAVRSVNRTAPPFAPARRLAGTYTGTVDFDLGGQMPSEVEVELTIAADGQPSIELRVDTLRTATAAVTYTSANANRVDFTAVDSAGFVVSGTARRNGDYSFEIWRFPDSVTRVAGSGMRL